MSNIQERIRLVAESMDSRGDLLDEGLKAMFRRAVKKFTPISKRRSALGAKLSRSVEDAQNAIKEYAVHGTGRISGAKRDVKSLGRQEAKVFKTTNRAGSKLYKKDPSGKSALSKAFAKRSDLQSKNTGKAKGKFFGGVNVNEIEAETAAQEGSRSAYSKEKNAKLYLDKFGYK